MSNITTLATGHITAVDHTDIELVEGDETPAVVIIRWPDKPTILHPRRFPAGGDAAVRAFAAASSRWRRYAGIGGFDSLEDHADRPPPSRSCAALAWSARTSRN
jgi:hypothetical protein